MTRHDDGFTLIELMVAITITLVLLGIVPRVLEATTHGADYAQGTSAAAAQALTLVQELESRVESASRNLPAHPDDDGRPDRCVGIRCAGADHCLWNVLMGSVDAEHIHAHA